MISVVIPMLNERGNVLPLIDELEIVLKKLDTDYEMIAVDDGSKDGTFEELKRARDNHPKLKSIKFSRNFGQSSAFAAGIAHAKGDIIVTIDGDSENDPNDIPALLQKLDSGYDLVSGWRQNRWKGKFLTRKIPSILANGLISKISGVKLHDYGCMLKAYKKEVIDGVVLYGEMHRFIPAFVYKNGAKISEIPVNFRQRTYGVSKYGFGRTFKVLLDLMFLKYFLFYSNKPIHFFGGIGLFSIFLGFVAIVWALTLKFMEIKTLVSTPLPIFAALFLILGVISIGIGILAEMLMRIYYESQDKTPYKVKEKINL